MCLSEDQLPLLMWHTPNPHPAPIISSLCSFYFSPLPWLLCLQLKVKEPEFREEEQQASPGLPCALLSGSWGVCPFVDALAHLDQEDRRVQCRVWIIVTHITSGFQKSYENHTGLNDNIFSSLQSKLKHNRPTAFWILSFVLYLIFFFLNSRQQNNKIIILL